MSNIECAFSEGIICLIAELIDTDLRAAQMGKPLSYNSIGVGRGGPGGARHPQ